MSWETIISNVGVVLSLGGLIFSVMAWREAKKAKTAANKAAKGVKRQSIAMDIAEVCQKCQINFDVGYDDIRSRYNIVNDDVSRILGLYSQQEKEDEDCKKILDNEVVNSLKEINLRLSTFNPIKQETESDSHEDKFYYYQFSELFSDLSGNLNKFKGALENQLTNKE